jgi:Ca-activated chloride channel family protein
MRRRAGRLGPALAAAVAAVALLVGCTPSTDSSNGSDGGLTDGPNVLRVLAGSEVADMVPILDEAEKATGVKVELQYTGTLDGTTLIASGGADRTYDASWFANNRYLSLLPGATGKIGEAVKIMSSPVVLGLKTDVAHQLGWDTAAPTWSDIATAAEAGRFTYGMTNPAASNSGFSALVSVATALSGTGSALTESDIASVTPQLTSFFSAQKLTAGSSGWLADTFKADPSQVDGIINYESVLQELKVPGDPLTIVTPSDGVVTNDYPLTLLTSASAQKKANFEKVTKWLTSTKAQKEIVQKVHRRPGVPGVDTGGAFPSGVLFATPFPNTLDVANSLISAYLDTARAPSQAVFALDTSGSMEGDRLDELKKALTSLTGVGATSTAAGFAQFRPRERITLLPFNTDPGHPIVVDVPDDTAGQDAALGTIRDTADGLYAGGNTAIYSTLRSAYKLAVQQKQDRPGTFVSVVLMTDGENTTGISSGAFTSYYKGLGADADGIPTFVVLFGDGDPTELNGIAKLTGGKVFNALNGDLTGAFQEIRGYQ